MEHLLAAILRNSSPAQTHHNLYVREIADLFSTLDRVIYTPEQAKAATRTHPKDEGQDEAHSWARRSSKL